jgi:RNA polymerase sigma factor (sigma-70 family)
LTSVLASELPADATRQLYERHSSRIFGFCLSRLGSREEAEDAVQTTFLNAQRGLGRGVVPEYELAWLFKIAQNVCHNRHQSARRRGRVEGTQDIDALQDVIASPERSPAVSLGELTRALGAIPMRQRRALLLREFQGYSYEEIAAELDVSVAAVETLLFRARRAVAQELEQQGATPQRRSRGAAASIFELFRWLFGGAAAPAKLAVLAAVATTATASLIPVGDAPAKAPPAAAPKPPALSVPARGLKTAQSPASGRQAPHVDADAAHSAPAGAQQLAPDTGGAPTASAPASSAQASPPPASLPSVTVPPQPAAETALPAASTPEVSVPSVSTPAVTTPAVTTPIATVPAVTVPAVTLPALTVPSVGL